MNIHVIVDFMHIYYKYFFQVREGRMKLLSTVVEQNGVSVEKDTTLIYYPLKDIESIREQMEKMGHTLTMSICFDTKSLRNESGVTGADEYKSGRKKVLSDTDYENINCIYNMLSTAGHNVYRVNGYEADDVVNHLARKYSEKYDYTVIYTNDKDLLININDKVGVMRFKQYKGYSQVDRNNYESYLAQEFGVYIPYNLLGLYLASVGDTADNIKGIYRFGKKAFTKLLFDIQKVNEVELSKCGDYDELYKVVEMCKPLLNSEQYNQLLDSFKLVSNIEIQCKIDEPNKVSDSEKRTKAYSPYKMTSLI